MLSAVNTSKSFIRSKISVLSICKRNIPTEKELKYLKVKPNEDNNYDPIRIEATIRDYNKSGSRRCRELRDLGFVPGVLYGKDENILRFKQLILVNKKIVLSEYRKRQNTLENTLYNIVVTDSNQNEVFNKIAVIRQIQFNSMTGDPLSLNFLIYSPGLTLSIPVEFTNEELNENAKYGYFLQEVNDFVDCVCTDKIPKKFNVDISNLPKNGVIRVKDLTLPDGVKIHNKVNPLQVLGVYKIPK